MGDIRPHPEWRELLEIYKDADYGTFISHEDIESIIGKSREKSQEKYYQIVSRFGYHMLKEFSRQIECQIGRGYEVIKPNDFRRSANRQLKFSHKRIKKAAEILYHSPTELMSDDEKKKIAQTSTLTAQLNYFSKATHRKIRQIEKQPDKFLLEVGKSALEVGD